MPGRITFRQAVMKLSFVLYIILLQDIHDSRLLLKKQSVRFSCLFMFKQTFEDYDLIFSNKGYHLHFLDCVPNRGPGMFIVQLGL